MPWLADLIATVTKEATDALSAHGFRKHGRSIYTLMLSDRMIGWVGFNRATYNNRGPLDIYPIIGVRDQEIEKTVARLYGRPRRRYSPPTISEPLRYLMPEASHREWFFARETRVVENLPPMIEAIVDYGMPFMHAHASRAALIAYMRPKTMSLEFASRLPVGLYLEGHLNDARVVLDQRLADFRDRTDAAAEEYRAFARALQAEMASSPFHDSPDSLLTEEM